MELGLWKMYQYLCKIKCKGKILKSNIFTLYISIEIPRERERDSIYQLMFSSKNRFENEEMKK